MSCALTHLLPARGRPNLEIRSGALVDRVVLEAGHAVALEVITDGRAERIAARRITLSAGAIGSPAILMRSGIGPADDLRELGIPVVASLPVGSTLLDHPSMGVFAVPAEGFEHDRAVTVEVGLRYTSSGSEDPRDMVLYPATMLDVDLVRGFMPDPVPFVAIGGGLMRARSTGRLRLVSTDPAQQPDIDLGYMADRHDLDRMVGMIRFCRDLCRTPELRPFIGTPLLDDDLVDDDAALEEAITAQVQTAYHPAGTAPMGSADDERAVVDAHGRVHGVEGLRVADASIMPTSVRNNTHLACVMVGERVASWMVKEP